MCSMPGDRLGSIILGDPVTSARLFEAGLLEAVYHRSYQYLGNWEARGFVRVTEAGREALEAGRFRTGPA